MPIAAVLKALRLYAGLSLSQFGELIGMSKQRVSALERGDFQPTLPTLQRISEAMDYPVWKIIRKAERQQKIQDA